MAARAALFFGLSRAVARRRTQWMHPLRIATGCRHMSDKPDNTSEKADMEKLIREMMSKSAADAAQAESGTGPAEAVTGEATSHKFEAETKQLLEIVAKSLYTDKEVFVRELISNASDALEKRRHNQLTSGDASVGADSKLEISISCDSAKRLLVVQDSGVGMTREELVENLGCIARSGSKAFIQQVQGEASASEAGGAASSIIGRFGVGFYSVFMVADSVRVFSRHADSTEPEGEGECWASNGDGSYTLSRASNVAVGTKVELTLKQSCAEFASKYNLERIIRKHSSFVTHPVRLHGERLNTLEPVWMKPRGSVGAEEHEELYRHLASAYDSPRFTLQFETDAPLHIKSVFYVPHSHREKLGMGQQEPCVSLYSRKVLITPKCAELLPGWLRFMVGVVDSEDVPLNISREAMQDSALLRRMSQVLSARILRFLADHGKREPEAYAAFYAEFSKFLKEGACTEQSPGTQKEILRLLRFESSKAKPGEQVSLDEYISRMAPEQGGRIYYLVSSSRAAAEASAYMEVFEAQGTEVLLCFSEIDDFVFQNAASYEGKALLSAAAASLSLAKSEQADALSETELRELALWMLERPLAALASEVVASSRLVGSPAVISEQGGQSASMRRFMTMVDQSKAQLPKQRFELNPAHPIIRQLARVRSSDEPLASLVTQQLFDNALIGAGMLDDARPMLGRLNTLLARSLNASQAATSGGTADS